MKTPSHRASTPSGARALPRTVRADTDLAQRCRRAERTTFAALVLTVLLFAGSGVQPGSAYLDTPPAEAPAFGWP
jgi:hypothetical protein